MHSITNAFQNYLTKSKLKPSRIWADQGSEFYNRSVKSWLHKNEIKLYSTYTEGKPAVAETFIRTLKVQNLQT